jgi:hypothetical protein
MNRSIKSWLAVAVFALTAWGWPPDASTQSVSPSSVTARSNDVALEVTNGNYVELLDADGADIRDVLDALSRQSAFEIIIEGDIKGEVTIFLTDIDLRDALRIILDRLRLAFSEETAQVDGVERNIIRIMSYEAFRSTFGYSFDQELGTRIIPVVYADFEDIAGVLEALKTPEGKIIFNRDTKTFILMDDQKALKAMEEIIKKLDVPVETKEFVFNSKITDAMAQAVKDRLTKDTGRLEVNAQNNSMVVTDSALKIKEIERIVRDLDLGGKKVRVDAKAIQIILSEEHETGVDWEAIVSNYKKLDFIAFDTKRVLTKDKEHLSFGTISAEDLNILTEALETVGEIKTVFVDQFSSNGQQEIGIVLSEEAIASVDEEQNDQEYPLSAQDIKFSVTPRVVSTESINVNVVPSQYRIADREAVNRKRQNIIMRGMNRGADLIRSATSIIPGMGDGDEPIKEGDLIEERFPDAVSIDVENGSTVVIGTMIKEVYVKRLHKIPLLGDLPILGFAFQSEGAQLRNSEVIVFLTVSPDED